MGILKSAVLTLLLALLLVFAPAAERPALAATGPSEYQLKAVFLFNFAQFVEWPPAAFADAQTPLVIAVVGTDPFGAYLDEVVRGEQVRGRALVVRRFRKIEEANDCHILFLGTGDVARGSALPPALAQRHVLTVSDADRVAARGVIIQFVDVANRIRLRIDVDSAQASGLTISSKLLRAAEIVGTPGDGP